MGRDPHARICERDALKFERPLDALPSNAAEVDGTRSYAFGACPSGAGAQLGTVHRSLTRPDHVGYARLLDVHFCRNRRAALREEQVQVIHAAA